MSGRVNTFLGADDDNGEPAFCTDTDVVVTDTRFVSSPVDGDGTACSGCALGATGASDVVGAGVGGTVGASVVVGTTFNAPTGAADG